MDNEFNIGDVVSYFGLEALVCEILYNEDGSVHGLVLDQGEEPDDDKLVVLSYNFNRLIKL